jgi:uncharacterized membrane protein YdjX (TVP38/TMEM64 family)
MGIYFSFIHLSKHHLKRLRCYLPQIMTILVWVGTIGGLMYVLRTQHLTLIQLAEEVELFIADHWYGPLIFLLVFLIRPFTLIPAILFVAIGGRIFGAGLGFVYGLTAMTASAIIPYYAGRLFAGELDAGENLGKFRRAAQRIARFLRRNAFEALVTLRMAYVPYDITSVVAGNIHVPLRVFINATIIGNLSVVYTFAALGAALDGDLSEGNFSVNYTLVALSVASFFAGLFIARRLRRHLRQHAGMIEAVKDRATTAVSRIVTILEM